MKPCVSDLIHTKLNQKVIKQMFISKKIFGENYIPCKGFCVCVCVNVFILIHNRNINIEILVFSQNIKCPHDIIYFCITKESQNIHYENIHVSVDNNLLLLPAVCN